MPAPTATIALDRTSVNGSQTATVTIEFSESVNGFNVSALTSGYGTFTWLGGSDGDSTYTATFTPNPDQPSTLTSVSLDLSSVTSAPGGIPAVGSATSSDFTVDTRPPSVFISMDDYSLTVGESATVMFTFSEDVNDFTAADLTVANGAITGLAATADPKIWLGTFTPTASVEDATNLISLNGVTDLAGNAGTGATPNYAIDTAAPTVSIAMGDSALQIGDSPTTVTFTFSEAAPAFSNSDLDLTLANGTLSAVSSSDGGLTYTATFTPTAGATQAVNVITVNAGVATDSAGNANAETSSPNFTIDLVRPTVTITMDDTVSIGETPTVTFAFSERIDSLSSGDLTATNGALSNVSSSDGGLTWTATFTPTAGGLTAATNVITVKNASVADLAGNANSGVTTSDNYAIDTVRPTVTSIVVADPSLTAGESSLVTITFSEAISGFTNDDLTIANGTLTAVTPTGDGGITWTATFTPTADVNDTSNVITLANTGVSDLAGNAGAGATDSDNFAINTKLPTASIVVGDNTVTISETSLVTITFSEAVSGFTNADLTIAGGTLTAVDTSDGGITYTATFTPNASTEDPTNFITLDNSGVQSDASGNAGAGTTDSNNYAIDTARPTVTIDVLASPLKVGETSGVTITFSEAVSGFTLADLDVANGMLSNLSTSNNITFTATLTPTADSEHATNVITLSDASVADNAGNTNSGTTESDNYAIDTKAPTVVSINLADPALLAGETSTVTITFSEAVTGFDNTDLSIPNGTLSAVSSSDGGIVWTAAFTPTADVDDASNLISLNKSGVTDLAGNAGTGVTNSGNFTIDTVRPTATITLADTDLKAGETSDVTIEFSEAVAGFSNADLTIEGGALSDVTSADGGITFEATFTPTEALIDGSSVITLDNSGVTNASGNAGAGSTTSNIYEINTARPTATITLAKAALAAGESTVVTIKFSEEVTGFTNADLTIDSGTLSAVDSDDGVTWTTTFTPNNAITDATNVITLDNAGVTNAASNAGVGTTASANFTINITEPSTPTEPTTPTPTPGDDVITLPATGGTISAGEGADSVAGVAGDDIINGNVGDDSVSGGGGDDVVRGGQGADFVQGNTGDDLIFGDIGQDTVHGGQGTDSVQGNAGDDYVSGDLGNDTVLGGQGSDVVMGGAGDDYVSGDLGNDTVTGGTGADLFNFSGGSGHDVVTDFSRAEGDHIRISPSDAANFSALSSHITSQGADTLITLGAQTVVLVGVSAGSLTAADFVFA